MIALALAAATPMKVADAERAFAADAGRLGQWTAFRKWAADDAVMFLPAPTPVARFLKDRPDPAETVKWWPTASFTSCDGRFGANTGGALWPGGGHGFFTTVWSQAAGGTWRWHLDFGDDLTAPRAPVAAVQPRRASCTRAGAAAAADFPPLTVAGQHGEGRSADGTLRWRWAIGDDGSKRFEVAQWDGRRLARVIDDAVPPPAPRATNP